MAQGYSADHDWIMATQVPIPEKLIKQAERRGTVRIPGDTKVDCLAIYCSQCRRPADDVMGQPCEAATNRDHLIGGPTGERRKRKHPYHDCAKYNCTLGQPGSNAV